MENLELTRLIKDINDKLDIYFESVTQCHKDIATLKEEIRERKHQQMGRDFLHKWMKKECSNDEWSSDEWST